MCEANLSDKQRGMLLYLLKLIITDNLISKDDDDLLLVLDKVAKQWEVPDYEFYQWYF